MTISKADIRAAKEKYKILGDKIKRAKNRLGTMRINEQRYYEKFRELEKKYTEQEMKKLANKDGFEIIKWNDGKEGYYLGDKYIGDGDFLELKMIDGRVFEAKAKFQYSEHRGMGGMDQDDDNVSLEFRILVNGQWIKYDYNGCQVARWLKKKSKGIKNGNS